MVKQKLRNNYKHIFMSKIVTVKTRKPNTRIKSLVSRSKYPKCHTVQCRPSPGPCSSIKCGNQKVFFRDFSPLSLTLHDIDTLNISPGDIWFDCSQNPSAEYIYTGGILYASDCYGNIYTVDTVYGVGTQVSVYMPLFDPNVGNAVDNSDIVISKDSRLGYIFGTNVMSPFYSIIYEVSLDTFNLTGRSMPILQLDWNQSINYLICAGTYVSSNRTIYICAYATFPPTVSLPFFPYLINQLYILNTTGASLTTSLVGNITGIPMDDPVHFPNSQSEIITGMTFDDVTNNMYFITSYNSSILTYQPSKLYILNLNTLVATFITDIIFPPTPVINNPIVNSFTKHNGKFYIGSYAKFDPDVPYVNSPYLFTMNTSTVNGELIFDGNLTAVNNANMVFSDSNLGGVVGLSSQPDYLFTQVNIS